MNLEIIKILSLSQNYMKKPLNSRFLKDQSYKKQVNNHGLWMSDEAFFHQYPKSLGLSRQIGQINLGAIGVFLANLSAPILIL